MNDIQNSLFEAMKQFSDYASANASSTVTIECDVQELLDEGQGLYRVGYLGNSFTVHASNANITYSVGEKVYVLVPDGDFTKEKIIFGSANPSAAQYATDNDSSSYYEISDNLVDLNLGIIKMSSYEDTHSTETDIVTGANDKKLLADVLSKYFNDYRTLSLGFSVQTSLVVDQQVAGNYGVTIGIPLIANKTTGGGATEQIMKYYTLDVGNMLGNPYRMIAWAPQHVYFDIDEQFTYDTTRVPTISYFCYGFSHDATKTNIKDIWLKDISLNVVEELTEQDKTGYTLTLKASEGEYFSENYKSEKVLTPTLKVNNKKTSISKCVVYWFREDASIKNDSKFYSPYGGFGWKCLNEKTDIAKADDGTETFTYITSERTWTILESEVESATRYKCVVIYDNSAVAAIITLKNLQSTKLIELGSTTGSAVFVKDTGYVDLTTTVYAAENGVIYTASDDYKNSIIYSWMRYDKNGNFISDDDEFFDVVSYNEMINKEFGGLLRDCYETRVKFPVNAVEDYNLIYCSAYLVLEDNGEIKKTLIGTKSYAITTSNDLSYLLTVNNGNKIFKYDSDGDSPMGEAYDGPAESKITSLDALTYNLYKLDGEELTIEEYYYCKYKWLIPVNSMIIVDDQYLDLDAAGDPIVTEDGFYVSSGYGRGTGLPYEIIRRYNVSKSNNTIILQVEFGGCKMENAVPMNFIKEGDNGTNGTAYAAVLVMGTSALAGVTYGTRNAAGLAQKEKFVYNISNGTWYYHDTATNKLVGWNDRKRIYPRVYQNSELLTYNDNYSVKYTMFDEKITNPCFNIQNVNSAGGVLFGVAQTPNLGGTYVNILQAEIDVKKGNTSISYASQKIYAYYPIEVTICNFQTDIIPSLDGGFAHVLYASDGTNPAWDETEDFTCNDGSLLGDDLSNYFEIEWSAHNHLVMPRLATGQTRYLGSSMHIEPTNKYDDGNSQNYIKTVFTFDKTKEQDLQDEIVKLTQDIADYNSKIQAENDNLGYLLDFANLYTLQKWYNDLDGIQELLDKQTNAVYRLNTLLETSMVNLDNYLNLQQNYNNIDVKTYCANLWAELGVLKTQCQKALEQIEKLNGTPGFEFSDLVSLANNVLSWNDNIKQTLISLIGLDPAITLQLLVQDVNTQISDYEASLLKLKSLDGMSYELIYSNIQTEILAACAAIPNTAFNRYVGLRDNVITYLNAFDTVTSITDIKEYIRKMYDDILSSVFKLKNNVLSINAVTGTSTQERIDAYQDELNATAARIANINKILATKNQSIVHIKPIVFTFNMYEMSNINGWDGNKLEMGDSYLLAPQVGAGYKNTTTNRFTGLVMGLKTVDTSTSIISSTNKQVGLFGYSDGVRSIFLNADNGSAVFGKANSGGQIIIDPSSTKALLYSSNYFTNYNNQTGLPSNYSSHAAAGMCIDLSTPEIRFGTGNFVVNSSGHITAKGGGTIADWKITDDKLTSQDNKTTLYSRGGDNDERIAVGNSKFVVYGDGRFKAANNKFSVDADGNINSTGGKIGGWTINSTTISSGGTTLNSSGQIECRDLQASNTGKIGGWTISSFQLQGGSTTLNSNGTITCENLIANTRGSIGGWNIYSNMLSGGSTTLNSNGTITCINLIANNQGQIGGWTIGSSSLSTTGGGGITLGTSGITGQGFTLNSNGLGFTKGTISLGSTGSGNNGISYNSGGMTVSGTIHAKAGVFGTKAGSQILINSDGSAKIPSACIDELEVSKIKDSSGSKTSKTVTWQTVNSFDDVGCNASLSTYGSVMLVTGIKDGKITSYESKTVVTGWNKKWNNNGMYVSISYTPITTLSAKATSTSKTAYSSD